MKVIGKALDKNSTSCEIARRISEPQGFAPISGELNLCVAVLV